LPIKSGGEPEVIVALLVTHTSFLCRINMLIVSLAVCGTLEIAMWTVISNRGSIFAFTILFGFFTGSWIEVW
jgi:hypothetical protein